MGCLYRLTSPSGKAYIGATTKTAAERFAQHLRDARNPRNRRLIGRAIEKYGAANFKVETLVISDDKDYLRDLEILAIRTFDTLWPRKGYNGCAGGNGAIAITEQAERRRVDRMKRTMATPEYKTRQRGIQAVVWDKARRAERSLTVKKLWEDPSYRERLRAAHTGKKASEATLMKKRARRASPETRAKMAEAQKQRWGLRRQGAAV